MYIDCNIYYKNSEGTHISKGGDNMAIAPISGMSQYRISSINGNPGRLDPMRRIGEETNNSNNTLVIATKKKEDNLYVKDFGELESPKGTVTGDFAEMLSIQQNMNAEENEAENQQTMDKQFTTYLNDTIGMMGYQNRVRDMLGGVSFTPYA